MRLVSVDLETHKIAPGLITPPIVCGAVAEWDFAAETSRGSLLTKRQVIEVVRGWLLDPEVLISNVNIAYDFGALCVAAPDLLPLIFKAYAASRVLDPLVVEALHAIACGHLFRERNGMPLLNAKGTQTKRYSLDVVVRHNLGRTDAKMNDFWKLRYALLEPLVDESAQDPFHLWPEEAKVYPVDDARNANTVTAHMLGWAHDPVTGAPKPAHRNLADAAAQCETDWALHLGAIWGLRTDECRVELLEARARELHAAYVERFTKVGFYRAPRPEWVAACRPDPMAGKEDTAAVARAVARAYGASGACGACGGTGKVPKREVCRGLKVGGRFIGCGVLRVDVAVVHVPVPGAFQLKGKRVPEGTFGASPVMKAEKVRTVVPAALCPACHGVGEVDKASGETKCVDCRGTGFGDLTPVPLTATAVASSRDTLAESGDETLMEYADNRHEKVLGTYVPYLRGGVHRPITLAPNVLVESGRVSNGGVIMLFPRGNQGVEAEHGGERVPSPRECFKARSGYVYGSSDFPAGELCSFAQVALWTVGFSQMAEIINTTKDPGAIHTTFGARMIGVPPEELKQRIKAGDKVAKGFRQAAKPWDFGALGGMGSAKLVYTNRKEGAGSTESPSGHKYPGIRFCILVGGGRECGEVKLRTWGKRGYEREIPPTCKACLEVAEHVIKPLFFQTFPEVPEYHKWIKRWLEHHDDTLPCFGPWITQGKEPHGVRKVDGFTSGANHTFQRFIADITKDAMRRVVRESYTDTSSVLYSANTRTITMMHDELFTEMLEEHAHLAGPRVGELMHEAYKDWIPDVHIEGVDTALQRYWCKDAESLYAVLFDDVSDVAVAEYLASVCGWKPDKASAAGCDRRAVFGDMKAAAGLAGYVRALRGTASEPRLAVWEPK